MSFKPNWTKMLNRGIWNKKVYGAPNLRKKGVSEDEYYKIKKRIDAIFEEDSELDELINQIKEDAKVRMILNEEENEYDQNDGNLSGTGTGEEEC